MWLRLGLETWDQYTHIDSLFVECYWVVRNYNITEENRKYIGNYLTKCLQDFLTLKSKKQKNTDKKWMTATNDE